MKKKLLRLHNLQGRKSYKKKKSSKLNVILSDLTFVIDRAGEEAQ